MLAQPAEQKSVLPLRGSGRMRLSTLWIYGIAALRLLISRGYHHRITRRRAAVAGAVENRMKTFGQVLREARKKAGITQRELAARLKREDGRPVDPPYLNAVEHDHRYPPEDYLIEQMARIVGISADVLYFHANRQPPDVKTEADQERLEAAYRAFRKALGVKSARKQK
jgi:transcriptional regulator with XRE-family HTH domain